jgi:hypothetical protein
MFRHQPALPYLSTQLPNNNNKTATMRLSTVAFALFASLAMAAPSPAGEVAGAGAEIDARGSCPAGCACDASVCRCASVCTIPFSPAVFGNGLSSRPRSS